MPGRRRSLGFSLVELVTIIVVLGALVFVAMPRLRTADSSLLTSRDTIVAALSHAQQIAMARDSAANPVSVVIGSNSIDVRENGASVNSPGAPYPFVLPKGVTITAGQGVMDYDKLGRTAQRAIILNGQVSIAVESSGYAR